MSGVAGDTDLPLHVTIKNYAGSVEHFYHFLLGNLFPLVGFLDRERVGDDRILMLRSCGPMDRVLRELKSPRFMLLDKSTHASLKTAFDSDRIVDLSGYDLRHTEERPYDIGGIARGVDGIRRRMQPAIAHAATRVAAFWTGRPRILLIERGKPDPFYNSPLAEIRTSGKQRRSISNHAALAESLGRRFGGAHNTRLEDVSLADQIALFEAADILIAQHGAALSNIVWMRPGTHAIEINYAEPKFLFGQLAAMRSISHSIMPINDPHGAVAEASLVKMVESLMV